MSATVAAIVAVAVVTLIVDGIDKAAEIKEVQERVKAFSDAGLPENLRDAALFSVTYLMRQKELEEVNSCPNGCMRKLIEAQETARIYGPQLVAMGDATDCGECHALHPVKA